MSYEQMQQTPWNKAVNEAQAALAEEGIDVQVKDLNRMIAEAQARDSLEIEDLDDEDFYHPNDEAVDLMVDWLGELEELADNMPQQFNHYGWLVAEKLKDHLSNAVSDARLYLEEHNRIDA